MHTDPKKLPWLEIGYEIFGREGVAGLRIERLAREVGKSKSSFYHHFAELPLFLEVLSRYYESRAKDFLAKEAQCKRVVPDLIQLLFTHQTDVLFSRQLLLHRGQPPFQELFERASQQSVAVIADIWSAYLGIEPKTKINQLLLAFALENFYLNIREDHFTYQWMEQYLAEMRSRINQALRS